MIRKYIGEGLKENGFSYAGYKGDAWVFQKACKEGIIQSIYVNIYRFDVWQITFMLATNVPGKFFDASHIPGVDGDGLSKGYWRYQDEESLIVVLKKMLAFMKDPGMKLLEEASIPGPVYATSEMHEYLYLHHEELAESFIQKTGMIATGFDGENLERWFDYIEQRLAELRKEEFAAGRNEWLEMAAFLGEQVVKYCEGHWILSVASERKLSTVGYKIKNCKNTEGKLMPLKSLVRGYLANKERMMDAFLLVLNTAEALN